MKPIPAEGYPEMLGSQRYITLNETPMETEFGALALMTHERRHRGRPASVEGTVVKGTAVAGTVMEGTRGGRF